MKLPNKKIVFVTGGTGGFGKLLIEKLCRESPDWEIHAVARGGTKRFAEMGSPAITEAFRSRRLRVLDLELSKPDAIPENLRTAYGGDSVPPQIDALVHIAGFSLFGPVLDVSLTEFRDLLDLNLLAPLRLTQVLAPALVRTQGRVIAVSSVAGQVTLPFYGPYSASKHALEALWEGLFHELGWKGVRAAVIQPGSFRTGFKDRLKYTKRSEAGTDSRFQREMGAFQSMMSTRSDAYRADPQAVADLLFSMVTDTKAPSFRTPVGHDARGVLFLKKILPESWFRILVRKGFEKIALQNQVTRV